MSFAPSFPSFQSFLSLNVDRVVNEVRSKIIYIYIYANLIASFLVNLTAFDVVGNNSKKTYFS